MPLRGAMWQTRCNCACYLSNSKIAVALLTFSFSDSFSIGLDGDWLNWAFFSRCERFSFAWDRSAFSIVFSISAGWDMWIGPYVSHLIHNPKYLVLDPRLRTMNFSCSIIRNSSISLSDGAEIKKWVVVPSVTRPSGVFGQTCMGRIPNTCTRVM